MDTTTAKDVAGGWREYYTSPVNERYSNRQDSFPPPLCDSSVGLLNSFSCLAAVEIGLLWVGELRRVAVVSIISRKAGLMLDAPALIHCPFPNHLLPVAKD